MIKTEARRRAMNENPSTSTRLLSNILRPSRETLCCHFKYLGRNFRSCYLVFHDLLVTQGHQMGRQISQQTKRLVVFFWKKEYSLVMRNGSFTATLIHTRTWRLTPGRLPNLVVRHDRFPLKVKLWVWWNFECLVYFELVLDCRALNAELYSQQMDGLYEVLVPVLVNRNLVLPQQENAHSHTAKITLTKLNKLII